jgi:nucleotide-binding universal stress UspA family protein
MFRSILVAIDGSTHSKRALAEAVDLATAEGGSLTLIGVGAPPTIWPSPYVVVVPDDELAGAAQKVVDDAAGAVPDGIPVSQVIRIGRPADEIVATAKEDHHDLIVMGARGRGAATSMLLGSVSHAVLNQSPAAVLIVHDESNSGRPPE